MLIRGGGDLATGVAARLHRCGFLVLVTETHQPLAVRRLVSLAEAVYSDEVQIEELRGLLIHQISQIEEFHGRGDIPVIVDPEATIVGEISPVAVVDARMRKRPPESTFNQFKLFVGLGPGFTAGIDCRAVVETNRGHRIGRVIWEGSAEADTGIPESVAGYDEQRMLRAHSDGVLKAKLALGSVVPKGAVLAEIDSISLCAPFSGVLRGLIHDGLEVKQGMKVGDLDPRKDPSICSLISDKALAVGGGVLEVLLSNPEIRSRLGNQHEAF